MNYTRLVIEKEAPEEYGYDRIRYNLSEIRSPTRSYSTSACRCPILRSSTASAQLQGGSTPSPPR
ncbi:hypothetical protein [Mesorhizobium sp. B2-3-6]|uniref:hypothetical protein n=1 Tax=Mesorhizobium sp. B2-3-6 TaxID=2589957 RepID=UPI001FEE2FEA|nr:hypothetical protein [Mesorhizobium sp. B2-3-6]